MPYPRAHGYVTFFGDAFTQAEIWQTGLRLDGTDPPDESQLIALATAFEVLWDTAEIAAPAGRRFLGVKWAPQDTSGRYPDGEDAVEYLLPTPNQGAAGASYPQIALVLSMRTARSRGYASNGRMYVPSALVINTGTGLIDATDASDAAAAGATFIGAVNAVGLGDASVMSTVGAGRIEPITGVRVGRVMDTQRRRRNALPESYTAESPVPL
jgi:hypothetical protein